MSVRSFSAYFGVQPVISSAFEVVYQHVILAFHGEILLENSITCIKD